MTETVVGKEQHNKSRYTKELTQTRKFHKSHVCTSRVEICLYYENYYNSMYHLQQVSFVETNLADDS